MTPALTILTIFLTSSVATAALKRTPITCEAIAALHQKAVANKMAGAYSPKKIEIHPKSWATIPAVLQTLPPGATFCGSSEVFMSDTDKHGIITADYLSPMWDKEIADFYRPIAAKMGCELEPMDTSDSAFTTRSRTAIKCPKHVRYTISAQEDMFVSIGVSAY